MEGLDGGFFDGAAHPLGLSIRLGVIRLGQLVDDAIFIADSAKDGHPQKSTDGLVTVLGQVGKSHAVVRQNRVNRVGKALITPR